MAGKTSKRYPPELKERAVRMFEEIRSEQESEWAAMRRVAELLGITSTETVRKWVRQAQVDAGATTGVHPVAHAGTDMPLTWANAVGPAGFEPAALGLKVGRTVCQVVLGNAVPGAFLQATGTPEVRDVSRGASAAGAHQRVR